MTHSSTIRTVLAGLLLHLALAGASTGGAAAGDDIGHDEARRLVESGRIRPLDAIVSELAPRVPGKLIETKLERDDGLILYDLKILRPEGRVQEVEVNAATGKILKIEDDD